MSKNFLKNLDNTKNLAVSMAVYSSASIFVPLILIGGAGYFIDKQFGTKPVAMIVGVFIAFIVTNTLLYKKSMALSSYISSKYGQEKDEDKDKNKD